MLQVLTQEEEDSVLESIQFRDLIESKVNVRSPCNRCEGKRIYNGEECEVCNGTGKVTQPITLLRLAKKMMPYFIQQVGKALAAADQQQQQR
jgi:DnaJ-class molecular chaperone